MYFHIYVRTYFCSFDNRVQEKIGLKEVGRHFYNEGQKATIPVHK